VETFVLEQGDHIELHDLLKVTGLAPTGGAAKMAIAEGLVMVDGEVETRKRRKVRKGQQVEYQGKKIVVA
jgi:ribosome-associated protein